MRAGAGRVRPDQLVPPRRLRPHASGAPAPRPRQCCVPPRPGFRVPTGVRAPASRVPATTAVRAAATRVPAPTGVRAAAPRVPAPTGVRAATWLRGLRFPEDTGRECLLTPQPRGLASPPSFPGPSAEPGAPARAGLGPQEPGTAGHKPCPLWGRSLPQPRAPRLWNGENDRASFPDVPQQRRWGHRLRPVSTQHRPGHAETERPSAGREG